MHSIGTDIISVNRPLLQQRLFDVPRYVLGHYPTPIEELPRLRAALGGGPRLLVKRDDAIPFACGGNKVRKLEMVAAHALAEGADTLVTSGGLQSNHARATAAVATRLGLRCVVVVNGQPQEVPTGNARLMKLFGADVEYVEDRGERTPRMRQVAARLEADGRRPYIVPLGASTGRGTLGLMLAVHELLTQVEAPDVIVLAASSGGTQAGIVGGCLLFDCGSRVIGVSADEPAAEICATSTRLLREAGTLLWVEDEDGGSPFETMFEVNDTFVGDGYGRPSVASRQAAHLAATTEGLILDPVYTAKAMACVVDGVRRRRFSSDQTILFWHTGGLPGFFS